MVDVSVVIPTLNEETRIVTCLKSIRASEFSGTYEVIIADCDSEDKTIEVAKPYIDSHVSQSKRTIAANRQVGGKAANGKVILYTDADTIVEKDWIQKVWDVYEKHPNVGAVYGNVFFHDTGKVEKKVSEFLMPKYLKLLSVLKMHSPIGSNLSIRKDVFDEIGGFDPDLVTAEDLDLCKKVENAGKELYYEPEAIVYASARRVKEWGYLYYTYFHITNAFKYHSTGKSHNNYDKVE